MGLVADLKIENFQTVNTNTNHIGVVKISRTSLETYNCEMFVRHFNVIHL